MRQNNKIRGAPLRPQPVFEGPGRQILVGFNDFEVQTADVFINHQLAGEAEAGRRGPGFAEGVEFISFVIARMVCMV